ncbi:MAG: RibD family protein [Leptolyngbyaceae bacterium]|nr:RibD family protein [Leptolyngbyaceae bacterium]
MLTRPHTTVVLAMSADGKIADWQRSPARFGSAIDKAHLEQQIALADGVLFGAGTLRAYGTTLRVSHPPLLQQRQEQGKPAQPVQIVASQTGLLDSQYPFFQQPVPRWLITTTAGAQPWQGQSEFERVLRVDTDSKEHQGIDWIAAFQQLVALGLERLVVAGGGELVASLLALGLIDELWLTVCPLILGGATAPTPAEGIGFLAQFAPRLELVSAEVKEQEVFLHYRLVGCPTQWDS